MRELSRQQRALTRSSGGAHHAEERWMHQYPTRSHIPSLS